MTQRTIFIFSEAKFTNIHNRGIFSFSVMPWSYKRKRPASYTADQLQEALRAIRGGMSLSKAARQFNISRPVLTRHSKKGPSLNKVTRYIFTDATQSALYVLNEYIIKIFLLGNARELCSTPILSAYVNLCTLMRCTRCYAA